MIKNIEKLETGIKGIFSIIRLNLRGFASWILKPYPNQAGKSGRTLLTWAGEIKVDQTMVGSDVTTPVLGSRYPNEMCLKSSIYPLDSSIYCSALIWIVWTKAIRHPCETGEWKIKFEISHFSIHQCLIWFSGTHWSAQNSPSEKEILLWQYLTKGHNVHLCK